MRFNPRLHHRRSIRLPAYDYAQSGAYFITICTHNRERLLAGRLPREIVSNAWRELPHRFPAVRLDQFIIMPNHVHGIIWITDPPRRVGAQLVTESDDFPLEDACLNSHAHPPGHHAAPLRSDGVQARSLGSVVRAFKSRAAKRINRLRRTPGAPVWQRNYYEHIIRGEEDLARIRQYIIDNPAKWAEDEDNPANWRKPPHRNIDRRGAAPCFADCRFV